MNLKNIRRASAMQSGFTLIELVIVIVVIGILAAVAVPNIAATSEQAYIAKQEATLGALKSTWAAQYAVNRAAPSCAAIATAMADPVCTATGSVIKCTGVELSDGTSQAEFTCGTMTTSPAITITKSAP